MSIKRITGKKNRSNGISFEEKLEDRCEELKMGFVRIPNGCKRFKKNNRLIIVPVKSPFDYVIFYNNKSVSIDTKSLESNNLTYSILKKHQVDSLNRISDYARAGYLVWFRETNKVIFYDAKLLKQIKPRSSLSQSEGILLGDILNFDLNLLF